jgi:hypothetical protein
MHRESILQLEPLSGYFARDEDRVRWSWSPPEGNTAASAAEVAPALRSE